MAIVREAMGHLPDGRKVEAIQLTTSESSCSFSSYGATLLSFRVPDREGVRGEVILGFDDLASRLERDVAYLGGTVGRYANRIAFGRYDQGGRSHRLLCNEGEQHLHGGPEGFDKRLWSVSLPSAERAEVIFELCSEDGDQGYPGRVELKLHCSLEGSELSMRTEAKADATTPLSITHHGYFNLHDGGAADVLDHEVMIPSRLYTPVDDRLIPRGELAPVEGTPLDFRAPRRLGDALELIPSGFDHNYVVEGDVGVLRPAARALDPKSGRQLEVLTTHAGVQFYSGNFLSGIRGRDGVSYERHHGFCLEPQHFPDAVNHPAFPSPLLNAGERYDHTIRYRFSTV